MSLSIGSAPTHEQNMQHLTHGIGSATDCIGSARKVIGSPFVHIARAHSLLTKPRSTSDSACALKVSFNGVKAKPERLFNAEQSIVIRTPSPVAGASTTTGHDGPISFSQPHTSVHVGTSSAAQRKRRPPASGCS
mmetsp:Transcript_37818/g.121617  ORF Transcript_37818/g.121617 Transcript_37818/m.121617 type:complete len:135 (+) Transcript_37818:69-473(+)